MTAALAIGFFGSLHCIGMCGPLTMSVLRATPAKMTFWIYHSGRLISYGFLGLVLGLIGQSLVLLQIQRTLSLLMGLLLIIFFGWPFLRRRVEAWYTQTGLYTLITRSVRFRSNPQMRWLISGLANGLLPCGLTYVAAAAALFQAGFIHSFAFMLLFGLGTLPAMWALAMTGQAFTVRLQRVLPRLVPSVAFLTGIWLVLRGSLLSFPDFQTLVREHARGLITICGI